MNERANGNLDRLLLQYVDALDTEDWSTYAAIWRQAETDRELEAALYELHQGFVEEYAGDAGRANDADTVRRLLEEHFAERPPEDDADRPLTVGDVAARLQADWTAGSVRMTEADRVANEQLIGSTEPLPEQLKQSVLDTWRHRLSISASKEYWRQFRQAAIRLMMARSHQQTRLAAAREQTPRKKKEDRHE